MSLNLGLGFAVAVLFFSWPYGLLVALIFAWAVLCVVGAIAAGIATLVLACWLATLLFRHFSRNAHQGQRP